MEVRKKVVYEAPKADAVELKTERIVCDSTNYERIVCDSTNYTIWYLGEGTPNPMNSTTEWDRTGYGSVEDF